MKKILIIALLMFAINAYSQTDSLLAKYGKIIPYTPLSVPSTYLLTPTSSSLIFDSSRVIVSVAKNGTGDSIIFYGGTGNIIATVASGSGSGGQWTRVGNDIYYNSGRISGGNTSPKARFNIESNALGGSVGGTSPTSQDYDTTGILLSNTTPATVTVPQNSPAITQVAHTWNTTGGHDDSLKFRWVVVPYNGAGQNGYYILQCAKGNGSYSNMFTISPTGSISSFASSTFSTLTTTILTNNTQFNANGSVYFNNGNNYLAKSTLSSSSTENYKILSTTGTLANSGGDKTWIGIDLSPGISANTATVKWTAFQNNGGNNRFNYVSGITNIGDSTVASFPASAIFRVATTTQGSIPAPVMSSTQWAAISSKSEGLQGWSNDDHGQLWYDGTRTVGFRYNGTKFQGYDGAGWVDLN